MSEERNPIDELIEQVQAIRAANPGPYTLGPPVRSSLAATILSPERSLAAALARAFPDIERRPPSADEVRAHVVWWLHAWGGEPEERVRRLVDVRVSGWPKIGVEVVARCVGGDRLLAAVRAAGGVMDL